MLELILLLSILSVGLGIYSVIQNTPLKIRHKNAVLLDTSALIDGRIVEVVKSGFVPSQLLVPRFVIAELQLLADKADHIKRERARFGLSVIQDLQASRDADIAIISDDIPEEPGVDEKLVKLAKKRGALLFTTDFNLLKVAEIEGVRVLNINELSQNLRPTRLPGEQAEIKIVQRGQERTQGVGYLDDGTLVVVEKAGSFQSQTVPVEFTRNLQTSAGRMMFAKMLGSPKVSKIDARSVTVATRPKASPRTTTASPKPRPQNRRRPQTAEDKLLESIANQ
ncbi:hypothetical protein KBD20_01035 [Candidatus Saccharibacteria bacterium]|nr:hypothetical protein [Candidatus Saccharibacteria bacterium]